MTEQVVRIKKMVLARLTDHKLIDQLCASGWVFVDIHKCRDSYNNEVYDSCES